MNGCVAVTRTEHIEPNPIGHSGSKAELLTGETDFGCRSWRPQVAVAPANHAHDLELLDRC
jgi:hypothetical protein